MQDEPLWHGLKPEIRAQLQLRDYSAPEIEKRLAAEGLEAGHALAGERILKEAGVWIPGVEITHRAVHPQRHRGVFAELGREGEGLMGRIGLWPKQWASARMFAGSAKGFHVHPPHIPKGQSPEAWLSRLFVSEAEDYSLRPYDREQWDVMYFLQGRLELILSDERAGLPRRRMRLFIEGDNHRGVNNVAVVIPPGVAHALRAEGSEDLLMVYGTTTIFTPAFEGRIAGAIESLPLPPEWAAYLGSESK